MSLRIEARCFSQVLFLHTITSRQMLLRDHCVPGRFIPFTTLLPYPIDDIIKRNIPLFLPTAIDSFTVPLHSPNGRPLGLCKGTVTGNSHWSRGPIMRWGTRQPQSIFRPTNHISVMLANWRTCLIPHWQPYYHHVRTVYQSTTAMMPTGNWIVSFVFRIDPNAPVITSSAVTLG